MPLSAEHALILARTNIEAAREAQGGPEREVIKHYQSAKNALDGDDAAKTGNATSREMIAAFEELAVVLDHSGEQSQVKAAKCRQKVDMLR